MFIFGHKITTFFWNMQENKEICKKMQINLAMSKKKATFAAEMRES